MFGAGVYFAENSSKSNNYVPNSEKRRMLICRVTLGESAILLQADSTLRRPPSKKGNSLYHSVIGESKSQNFAASLFYREFIVYDCDQAYPEFAVDYTVS
eukprot:TRINITY_DN3348_c1_g1_i4.p1 TRINITY_DN3348_c1_g1~~TRINITY_DN3348_c1_g1_i4.p1  ORF type:complete len:100 (-),score=20.91 TRINITY_DN3348_c1_g1_i4:76-375(-)